MAEGDFSPIDPEFVDNFWEDLREMREQCPVLHSNAHGGFWAVTRYEDVLAVAKDWKTYCNSKGISAVRTRPEGSLLIPVETDPPFQRQVRRVLDPCFSPMVMTEWEAPARAIASELIDGFAADGSCEFVRDFAQPLPARFFLEVALGLPSEELGEVHEWIVALLDDPVRAPEAMAYLSTWSSNVLAERRTAPRRPDVIDVLLHADVGGRPFTEDEQNRTLILLVTAGLETTVSALGNIMLNVATRPELWDKLKEMDSVELAIEEFLRFDAPAPALSRTALADGAIGGQPIGEGERVVMYYASANRDQRVFEDPDELHFDRSPNRHFAFGMGIHRCLGQHLARLELRVAVEELLKRIDDIRLDVEDMVYKNDGSTRGPSVLPLRFRSAHAATQ